MKHLQLIFLSLMTTFVWACDTETQHCRRQCRYAKQCDSDAFVRHWGSGLSGKKACRAQCLEKFENAEALGCESEFFQAANCALDETEQCKAPPYNFACREEFQDALNACGQNAIDEVSEVIGVY